MDPAALVTTIAFLGVGTKALVDALRRYWTNLDGLVVQAAATVLGIGEAVAFHFRATEALIDYSGAQLATPAPVIDYIITGILIAAGAGFLAELSGRSGTPTAIVEVGPDGKPL